MKIKTITVYGIPNCDSVKKARAWLNAQGLESVFHDFKKQGVPPEALQSWVHHLGWDKVLNKKGSTWRKLDPATQADTVDAASACAVMVAHSSTIKRPVIAWPSGQFTVGYTPEMWRV